MEATLEKTFELCSYCSCESYDEDTDTATPSTECFGCWEDDKDNFKYEILKPWLAANGWEEDTAIRIEGTKMTWLSRSGYRDTTAGEIVDALTIDGDFTLRYSFDGKNLVCVRSSHDEHGARFTFVERAEDEDEDY